MSSRKIIMLKNHYQDGPQGILNLQVSSGLKNKNKYFYLYSKNKFVAFF